MYCKKCNETGKEGAFCTHCGTKTIYSKFECPDCSATNPVTALYCGGCGLNIASAGREIIEMRMKNGA